MIFRLGHLMLAGGCAAPRRCIAATASLTDLDREVRSFLDREVDGAPSAGHVARSRQSERVQRRAHDWRVPGARSCARSRPTRSFRGRPHLGDATWTQRSGTSACSRCALAARGSRSCMRALSLRHYGNDLTTKPPVASLTRRAQELDTAPGRHAVLRSGQRQPINLPENYLGVAARIAAIAWDAELLDDRALRSIRYSIAPRSQFTAGALYADDALPTGRCDRYSQRVRALCLGAAQIAGRAAICSTRCGRRFARQMRLWWDLVSPDGYGYPWGRSVGVISYMDTLEIAGFLASTRVPTGATRTARRRLPRRLALAAAATTRTTRTCCRSSTRAAATSPTSAAIANGSRRRGSWASSRTRTSSCWPVRGQLGAHVPATSHAAARALRILSDWSPPSGVWLVRQGPSDSRCRSPRPQGLASPTICRRPTACLVSRRPSSSSCRR